MLDVLRTELTACITMEDQSETAGRSPMVTRSMMATANQSSTVIAAREKVRIARKTKETKGHTSDEAGVQKKLTREANHDTPASGRSRFP